MGGVNKLDALAARLAGEANPSVIRAYHGSPHDHNKFLSEKIGTGEGNQAYGYGLYFAGDEKVANAYRRMLAGEPLPMDLAIDGRPVFRRDWPHLPQLHRDGTNYLMSRLLNYSDEYAREALGEIQKDLPGLLQEQLSSPGAKFSKERRISELQGAIDLLSNRKVTVLPSERPGKTYEVEIAHPESSLLDWDRPLKSQGEFVTERLAPFRTDKYDLNPGDGTDYETGSTALHRIAGAFGDDMAEASAALYKAGIPGLRYLDRGSRSLGQGTRNYVMFPGTEDSIRILRKYAVPGAVGTGAASQYEGEQ